jgi:hypothetical protein
LLAVFFPSRRSMPPKLPPWNLKHDISPGRYWPWMRSKRMQTAGWFWKRRPIAERARPLSLWIRLNGSTASRPISRIRDVIVKDFTGPTPIAGGFPWRLRMTTLPACRQRDFPSATIRIAPEKPAARGPGWSGKFSRLTLSCAPAAAECTSSPLSQSPARSTASCAISEAPARKLRILLCQDRLPPQSQTLCNNSEAAADVRMLNRTPVQSACV